MEFIRDKERKRFRIAGCGGGCDERLSERHTWGGKRIVKVEKKKERHPQSAEWVIAVYYTLEDGRVISPFEVVAQIGGA